MHTVKDRRCSCGYEWAKKDQSDLCPNCHCKRVVHVYAEQADIASLGSRILALEGQVAELEKRLANVEPVGSSLAGRLGLMNLVTGHPLKDG